LPGRNSTAVFLGLGGNIGDPVGSMAAALRLIDADRSTKVVRVSSVYRTPPWGITEQPDFMNAVAHVDTSLDPRALLKLCLDAERQLKRVRAERWGPRAIDIDILLYGKRVVHEEGLEIPHPRMLERAFVLVPLAEIAPEHAIEGVPLATLAGRVDTTGIVRLDSAADWWRDD